MRVPLLWYGMHVFGLEQVDKFEEGGKLAEEGFKKFEEMKEQPDAWLVHGLNHVCYNAKEYQKGMDLLNDKFAAY